MLSSAGKSSTFTAMTWDTNTKAFFQSVATIWKMCMQEHSISEICQSCERNPTGTQCQNDVEVASTSIQHHVPARISSTRDIHQYRM